MKPEHKAIAIAATAARRPETIETITAQRDALLAHLRRVLPFAERAVHELNKKMVGNLYPAINEQMLADARAAIALAGGKGGT